MNLLNFWMRFRQIWHVSRFAGEISKLKNVRLEEIWQISEHIDSKRLRRRRSSASASMFVQLHYKQKLFESIFTEVRRCDSSAWEGVLYGVSCAQWPEVISILFNKAHSQISELYINTIYVIINAYICILHMPSVECRIPNNACLIRRSLLSSKWSHSE